MQIKTLCNRYSRAAMHQQLPAGIYQRAGNRLMAKTVRIMKLTALMIFLLGLQVQAKVASQKITFSGKNVTLEKAFAEIKAQTGYLVIGNKKMLDNAGRVTIYAQQMPLKQFLELLLKNQELQFSIEEQTIIVAPKRKVPASATATYNVAEFAAPPPPVDIRGYLYRKDGTGPLAGATVSIKGTRKSVITDNEGKFNIAGNVGDALLITYIGYTEKEVAVTAAVLPVIYLEASANQLDETVVMAYGTTTRRFNTGNIVKVSSEDIAKQPVTNVLQALEGRMPGVFITQANGLPGAGITVQIRGVNSLTRGNLPFYVIDGVPYLSEPINVQTSVNNPSGSAAYTLPSAEGSTNPLNSINPSDIESIEVLKDADATAIYGSRGANGVVLITTKKGKAGKTKLNINVNTGRSSVAHFVELLGTEEYLKYRAMGYSNFGITPTTINAPDLLVWDQKGYTDFQRVLLGNTAKSTDVTAGLSGGDDRTNFVLSGSYHDETNVYPGAQGYNRASAKLGINHTSLDRKLAVGASVIYSADKNNISTTDLATYAYNLPPNFPLYNADGSLYWLNSSGKQNPLGYLNIANKNLTSNLLSSLNIKYTLVKGLDLKTTVGYSRTDMDQTALRPLSAQDPSVSTNQATASYTYNVTHNYIVEPQVSYRTPVWKGTLEALAGGSWQYKKSRQPYYMTASGFASDEFITNPGAAATLSVSTSSQDYKYASMFGRINYNLEGKYLVNLVVRRDGSSRFGPDKLYGNFGSAGAAWIFSQEKPVQQLLPWLSFGKLRGSYGVVGNDAIGNYTYLQTYTTTSYVYNGSSGLVPARLANNDVQWESTRKLELSVDAGFLKDRILVSASFYRNRTSNQLINYTISAQAGFTSYQANLPATVQNKGWEFTLNTINIKNKDFTWNTSLNISFNRNKLLAFPNIEKSSYYTSYVVGNPISSFYAYQYTGIDATSGLPTFADLNKDGATSGGLAAIGRGDRRYIGAQYPNYYGGLLNSFSYKGITLDVMLQFTKRNTSSLYSSSFYPPGYIYNASAKVMRDYIALGDPAKLITAATSTTAARAAYIAYSNYTASDAVMTDASFIRVKNVSLSYTLPVKWATKAKMQNLRVYLQAQNLFTFTGYEGFDPESASVATPPLRTIATGIQVTF